MKIYSFILALLLSVSVNAQSSDTSICSCIKPFFDYLLKYNKLSVVQQDNVTVQSLIGYATAAGYNIDVNACTVLKDNLSKNFYTITPEYVRASGYIVTAKDSSYTAVLGNYLLKFTPTMYGFEQKLSSIYSKNCRSNQVEYTFVRPVNIAYSYSIKHLSGSNTLNWNVTYTDEFGIIQNRWFSASDTLVSFCGTSINSIQDVDTINHIYATAAAEITTGQNICTFNPDNYYRPTSAILTVEPLLNKTNDQLAVVIENPTHNIFRISLKAGIRGTIKILSSLGSPIETKRIDTNSQINIGGTLSPGIYYAEVIAGGQRQLIKLIKL